MFVLKWRYNDYSEAEDFQLTDLWHDVKYAHNRCRAEVYSFYVGCLDHNRIRLAVQKEIHALLEVRNVTIQTLFISYNQFGSITFSPIFLNFPPNAPDLVRISRFSKFGIPTYWFHPYLQSIEYSPIMFTIILIITILLIRSIHSIFSVVFRIQAQYIPFPNLGFAAFIQYVQYHQLSCYFLVNFIVYITNHLVFFLQVILCTEFYSRLAIAGRIVSLLAWTETLVHRLPDSLFYAFRAVYLRIHAEA